VHRAAPARLDSQLDSFEVPRAGNRRSMDTTQAEQGAGRQAPRRDAGLPPPWEAPVIFELFEDMVKMGFIVFCLHAVFRAYVHWRQPTWSALLQRRRLAVVSVLVLGVLALKVTEDVLGGESGPIDRAILVFVHAHVSTALTAVFEAITSSGSAYVLVPLISAATVALVCGKRRYEASLLAASPLIGVGLVYVVKTLVGRARPELWASQWYAGSSFPSGHTLAVAATATPAALVVTRLWPEAHRYAVGAAFVWTILVALSRLVLGVHWPTDVLAAACIGAAIPLALSLGFAFNRR
jgi:undecaprenyl-diphosphatase